jgi:sec-independent protein translocase protein TatB
MFDIGFSELLVIGVVALIVIGPERLPKVARTAGHLFGRFQRYVSSVKADIGREMDLEELRKAGQTFKESVEQAARGVESGVQEAEYTMRDEVVSPIEEAAKSVSDEEPAGSQAETAADDTNTATSGASEHKA